MLVLSSEAEAMLPALYQSPPLNPFQPIHSNPAPIATIARLFGASTSRSRWSRGPITAAATKPETPRSEEHTSELQSRRDLVCRLLLEKKKKKKKSQIDNTKTT